MSRVKAKKKACPAKLQRSGGFSLIEVLLVVGMAVIIFAFSAPYSIKFYRTQLLNEAQSNIIDVLERARHNAVLQKNDSNFGVFLTTGGYTLFQGSASTTRVESEDEVFTITSGIIFSGLSDVVFSKLTGAPNATGTITLTYENLSEGILIEEEGGISKSD